MFGSGPRPVAFPMPANALLEATSEVTTTVRPETLIGVSGWAQDARGILQTHARHDRPLALIGERGTGRKFLARQLHALGHRKNNPFIAIECQTLSPASLQATLLGLSAGGSKAGPGLLELARGGTLYLGGVQAWSEELSALLAFLDPTKTLSVTLPATNLPMSAAEISQFDVRIVFGVLPNDEHHVSGNAELIDRWNIPPLRERAQDVELLADYFLNEFIQNIGQEPRRLGADVRHRLLNYDWPGNVKELKSVMLYAVHHLRSAPVCLSDLPPPLGSSDPTSSSPSLEAMTDRNLSLQEAVENYERQLIIEALKRTGGHQTRAAQLLGVKLTTLNMKLSRLGIDPKALRPT